MSKCTICKLNNKIKSLTEENERLHNTIKSMNCNNTMTSSNKVDFSKVKILLTTQH